MPVKKKAKAAKPKKTAGKPSRRKPAPKKQVSPKKEKFFEAVGRRKTSVARVRIFPAGGGGISVNGKPYKEYFPVLELQQIVEAAFKAADSRQDLKTTVLIKGGGMHSQAEAARHGIARVLILMDPEYRKKLKQAGYLTRDARMRERKKFGLKRARRAPQWRKR